MSCEYCNEEKDIFKDACMYIPKGTSKLSLLCMDCYENGYMDSITINYCPMCGSKLGDSDD